MPAAPSLKARALRLLSMREYGREELARKIRSHAQSAEELEAVLQFLDAKGFISDARAANSLIHRRSSKLGKARLIQEMQAKGYPQDIIAEHAAALSGSEDDRARLVWQKKFTNPAATLQERAKQARFLSARGFSPSSISRLLRNHSTTTRHEEIES